ncbi:hypothetical protein BDF22DRAFT_683225 [Syncephalis plumigaleata]|nr:hypothetical protein BDF22DRAFT_683225 [Syncephalis plumigaleata]
MFIYIYLLIYLSTNLPIYRCRDHPESYHSFMWNHLFRHVDIPPSQVNILDGNAKDLNQECQAFEDKIKAVGGIELFLGGIGPDGHIAFNEPGSSLTSRTRPKTLATRQSWPMLVPKLALTVGVGTVMDAREVAVIITGQHKSIALAKCIEEGINHMWTVSAIQSHPSAVTVKYFKSIEKVHDELVGKENMDLQGRVHGSIRRGGYDE